MRRSLDLLEIVKRPTGLRGQEYAAHCFALKEDAEAAEAMTASKYPGMLNRFLELGNQYSTTTWHDTLWPLALT